MLTLTDKLKDAVYQQTSFLSGLEKPKLEDLLEMSKWDRRVRNVTPLYALLFQNENWKRLTKRNSDVFTLEFQFKKALNKLETSNSEASVLAEELKRTYFPGGKMYVLSDRNDVSDEMAKLLQSLVRSVNLNDSLSESTMKSVEERLKKVNFDNLFVN